jgi:outer membrane protein assembly factor BamB
MFSSSRRPWRRRRILLGGALLAVVLAAGVIGAVILTSEPGDVSNSDVGFERGDDPSAVPQPGEARRGDHPMDDGFSWPNYHLTRARTGYLPLRRELRPPFVQQWSVTGRILLEFPPVSCRRSLYLLKNNAALYKISRLSGRVAWKRKLGYLAASSPSCGGGSVYAVMLERSKGADGRITAVDAKTGRTRWSKPLPSRAESSPLLASGRLYFGTEDGTVYAMRARDGAVRWKARASGAVKGGLALSRGRLIFGDYGGKVHAIGRADGRKLWESSSAGSTLGLRAGRFYGTPAVAYGRVYIGSLDGFVYSFGAADGRLAWRHKTSGFVYSSPAVATVPGVGPTVYAGSFDGHLYAFDARSGKVRWRHDAGGRISGGPVVFGDLVLFSNLGRKSTTALGAATGKRVWATGRGAFNPAISDGRRVYLNGYSSLFMLSSRRQARIDERARRRLGRAAATPRRRAERRAAARERSRRRAIDRRVAARRAAVRRANRLRRAGREVCFTRDGRKVCRVPRPVVCFKRGEGDARRTVCRARRP